MPNRPSNYADIEMYRNTTRAQNKRHYAKSQDPERRRRLFSEKEDLLILLHQVPDSELAKLINRSEMSIQLRRSRLKKKAKQLENSENLITG